MSESAGQCVCPSARADYQVVGSRTYIYIYIYTYACLHRCMYACMHAHAYSIVCMHEQAEEETPFFVHLQEDGGHPSSSLTIITRSLSYLACFLLLKKASRVRASPHTHTLETVWKQSKKQSVFLVLSVCSSSSF